MKTNKLKFFGNHIFLNFGILLGIFAAASLITTTLITQECIATSGQISPTSNTLSEVEDDIIKGLYPYYSFFENPENPWTSVWDALDATDTYEYSDQYFAVKSPGIHANLRTMSYALALAGFENQADGYPYDDDQAANPKLRKLLQELGFSDYQSWDDSSEINGHSMGTSIAHKTIIYKNDAGNQESKELVVVAPRNYNYMTEWLSNFNVGETGDHAGFAESANLIVSRLNQYLANHHLSNYKIWIVGYSRGGAVVDLAAKTINENLANYSMSADDLYAYTFGAPRASTTDTEYANIHDVKDGNDLLLGYLFPKAWGFYNTGVYEEIHPADLKIDAYAINLTDFADSSKVVGLLINSENATIELDSEDAKQFIDSWLNFITKSGLTRNYFNSVVKPPLSKLMQAYQQRTVDKQSDFSSFFTSMDKGLLGNVASNILVDLVSDRYPGDTIEERLDNFPLYQDLIKILNGTATTTDITELANYLKTYIGNYDEYIKPCAVTESEFLIIKEALPDLIKAIAPIMTEDAKYTIENKGEGYSLYYITTLVSNFNALVYGHTPENIMPILKSYTDPSNDPTVPSTDSDNSALAPNTGVATSETADATASATTTPIILPIIAIASLITFIIFREIKKAAKRR